MTVFRFVRHEAALDHARLGWHLADTLEGTPHGLWSVLMQWLCGCPEVVPVKIDDVRKNHVVG